MAHPEWFDEPESLWHGSGLGREEFLQRLLSTLVFGHADHHWNRPGEPSDRGAHYIRELFTDHFGQPPSETPQFVDEFELPRRHDDERAGWPDQAAFWPDRLFLIELKTERRSHRPGQMDHYLDLAVHHHRGRRVDALYLTPSMAATAPQDIPTTARYAHASWSSIAPIIADIWSKSAIAWERRLAELIVTWIEDVEDGRSAPAKKRRPVPTIPSPEAETSTAMGVAREVQVTGKQAALDMWLGSPEGLEELRLDLRDRFRRGAIVDGVTIENVLPWTWSAGSSGGQAMTKTGSEHGYELRFSRYEKKLWGSTPASE